LRPAEELLTELSISDPNDIDIEAIAHCVGVEVEYRPLSGCEAQIIGFRNSAVIYVRDDMRPTRKKFSGGHELGHWYHHRGLSFVCRSDDIGRPTDEKSRDAERLADAYSADLILPPFMVAPRLERLGDVTMEGIIELARNFSTSVTATAIRIVRMTRQPLILVASNLYGRKWQWPSIAAGGLKIREDLDARASAFSAVLTTGRVGQAKKEPANYWFDRRHVEKFEVRVQSIRTTEGEILTLLRILDPKMIDIYG
jgi:Zn-dependent peptidase ImmA (M78 family)